MSDDLLARLRTALVDHYAVEAQIARGSMATVFRARDLKHDRLVAIKVVDAFAKRGVAEARATVFARASHARRPESGITAASSGEMTVMPCGLSQ